MIPRLWLPAWFPAQPFAAREWGAAWEKACYRQTGRRPPRQVHAIAQPHPLPGVDSSPMHSIHRVTPRRQQRPSLGALSYGFLQARHGTKALPWIACAGPAVTSPHPGAPPSSLGPDHHALLRCKQPWTRMYERISLYQTARLWLHAEGRHSRRVYCPPRRPGSLGPFLPFSTKLPSLSANCFLRPRPLGDSLLVKRG